MMKRIAFTICSNNYLAQAITLSQSFKEHNKDVRFVICLVDKKNAVENLIKDYDIEILEVEDVLKEKIYELAKIYDIVEFNTSVKPTLFKYFLNVENYDSVIYLDPDIVVFNPLDELFKMQEDYEGIVTPHITSPSTGTFGPDDWAHLRGGIYNLGFLSLTKSIQVAKLLDWWEDKLFSGFGLNDMKNNLFTDQLWINYLPCFVDKYLILKHPGYNVAPWNLHQRVLTFNDDKYNVNHSPLFFFHFSGLQIKNDGLIPYTSKPFSEISNVEKIFNYYFKLLLINKVNEFSKIACFYTTRNCRNLGNQNIAMGKRVFRYLKKYPLCFFKKEFWVD